MLLDSAGTPGVGFYGRSTREWTTAPSVNTIHKDCILHLPEQLQVLEDLK